MATAWVCPIDGMVPADAGSAASSTTYGPDQTKGANSSATMSEATGQWIASTGSQVNLNGAAALGDFNGLPPHCPVCGAAMNVVSATVITAQTGVSSGSQHPADVNAWYVTTTDSFEAQENAASYAMSLQNPRQPHAFTAGGGSAHTVARGTAVVTAATLNSTQGP